MSVSGLIERRYVEDVVLATKHFRNRSVFLIKCLKQKQFWRILY